MNRATRNCMYIYIVIYTTIDLMDLYVVCSAAVIKYFNCDKYLNFGFYVQILNNNV